MLQFLRKRENVKKIMWGLAILIIPAFVLWGAGSNIRSGGPKYAGHVFGKKISFQEYRTALLACRNRALLIYGEEFNKVVDFLDLEREAWEWLVLLYQAKKEKIKVSDKQVIDFIKTIPFFQKEGSFNKERYGALLDYVFHLEPRDFEEQVREMLKIDELKNKITDKISLADEEIEEVYKNQNEKAKAFYVLIEPQKFQEQVHPAHKELEDYYQNHKTEFKNPEQVNVQYIALYFDQDSPEVNVSEEEIQDYYAEQIHEFKDEKENTKPLEEVKAQIEETLARDKTKAILEDKIWQLCDEIKEDPSSFEELAKKNQLEVKESGFFVPQQVVPEIGLSYEFLNSAFALKLGELSNVIETPKGYFIIKVKEKKEPCIPPLDEVREKVKTFVVMQKSRQLAQDKGKEVLSQIIDMMQEKKLTFSKAAEKLSLAVQETEEFSRFSYVSGIGQNVAEFTEAAFTLQPGEVSDLIEVANGYCILSPKKNIPIDAEKFAQEKEEFAEKLLARKKDILYKIWMANLKKKAKLVSNIAEPKTRQTP